jgi:hypothetical protein
MVDCLGLVRAGQAVNRKRVERLLCEHHITGITRRRRGLTWEAKRAVFARPMTAERAMPTG